MVMVIQLGLGVLCEEATYQPGDAVQVLSKSSGVTWRTIRIGGCTSLHWEPGGVDVLQVGRKTEPLNHHLTFINHLSP